MPRLAKRPEPSQRIRQAGVLTGIPFVLLVGPLLGYYLGSAADRRWVHAPWGMVSGIVLGLLASARLTIEMIRQSRDANKDA